MKFQLLAIASLATFTFCPAPTNAAGKTFTITYKCRKPSANGPINSTCTKTMDQKQYDSYLYRTFKAQKRICYNRNSKQYTVYDVNSRCNFRGGDRMVSKNIHNMDVAEIEAFVQVLVPRFLEIRRSKGLFDSEIKSVLTEELKSKGWPAILSVGLASETKARIVYRQFDTSLERPGDNDLVAARVPALNAASLAEFNAFNRSVERQWSWHNIGALIDGGYVGTPEWNRAVDRWVRAVRAR